MGGGIFKYAHIILPCMLLEKILNFGGSSSHLAPPLIGDNWFAIQEVLDVKVQQMLEWVTKMNIFSVLLDFF